MLQVFSKDITELVLDTVSPEKNIEMFNSHIKYADCKNIVVDITKLNVIDACMVSTLCSTNHYMKYPDGKINWVINNKDVANYTTPLTLGNVEFTCKNKQ